jgi:transposase
MRTVSLDLGARRVDFCEVGDGGEIRRATRRSLEGLEKELGPGTSPARVAFEACREGWHVARVLEEWGHIPVMVDTTRARQLGIGQHGRKTDRVDAERLAVALKEGRIPEAHILSPQRQELRFHMAVRRMLVESRAQYVTAVRGIVRAHGIQVSSCTTRDFLAKLNKVELNEAIRAYTAPLCSALGLLTHRVAEMDLRLEELCRQEPLIQRLQTVPGVGLVVAAVFVSVIDEATRFRDAHQVESYLGLVPSEASTGGRRRLGAISKAGNSYARALLVEAAWTVLRGKEDDPLRSWARQLARRRGHRIAVVALARRLVGILWAIWRDGTVYEPQRLGQASAQGVSRHAQDLSFQALALKVAGQKAARRCWMARRALR